MPTAPSPVDSTQLAAAVQALLAFIHRERESKRNLLDDDTFISLVIALTRTPEKGRTKAFVAPLAHSLYKDRPVCLITCDGLYKPVKEHLKANPIEGIEKVLGITKLRKEFSRFADKRKLSASYDLFLADNRLIHLLPKYLGGKFFDKKKHPSLISLDKKDITKSLVKGRDSTYFYLRTGPTLMIKIGRSSFSDKQIIENFNAAIGAIVEQIPKNWKGIQALFLRTATSVALPFYSSLPYAPKLLDSDTPQLTVQQNTSKRKGDQSVEQGASKKLAVVASSSSSSLPSSAPFSETLTLKAIAPPVDSDDDSEVDEKMPAVAPPATPSAPKSTKKKLKRKGEPSPGPKTFATPASKKPSVPPSATTPKPSAIKPTPSGAVTASPKSKAIRFQEDVPVTPLLKQPVARTPTPGPKKKVGGTPKPQMAAETPKPQALKANVATTPKPQTSTKKKGLQVQGASSPAIARTPTPGPKKGLSGKSTVKKHQ